MKYNTSKIIKLKKSDHSLYRWSLNEIDDDGQVYGDMIPMDGRFYFTASELQVHKTIKFEDRSWDKTSNDDIKKEQRSFITGNLFSGIFIDGLNLKEKVSYSMFGTDRSINSFKLHIFQVDSQMEEKYYLDASLSHDYENEDSIKKTDDDYIGICLFLTDSKFNELIKSINNNQINNLNISISMVDGFYSSWSPSIHTIFIKVLTKSHKIENVEETKNLNFPPKTGQIGDFSISWHSENQLNSQPNKNSTVLNHQIDERCTEGYNDNQERNRYQSLDLNVFFNNLEQLFEKHAKSVKRILLVIVIFLIFILAKII
jgi:hypothetical protein